MDFVSYNSAKTLCLGDQYGIEVGRPASFIIMPAKNDYEVVANQTKAILSVRNGKIIMQRYQEQVNLTKVENLTTPA